MILAIDFDGTLVDHRFPKIGEENPGAFGWLRRFQALGAKLILWTMRSPAFETEGTGPSGVGPEVDYLQHVVDFCRERGVEFWGVNQNPQQHTWTSSPKAYAHWYIDDAAWGCPLCPGPYPDSRLMVDWSVVGPAVELILVAANQLKGA